MVLKRCGCFSSLSLIGITVLFGVFLSSIPPNVIAEASVVLPPTAVTILSSCSMTANVDTAHTATLLSNTYSGNSEYYPNGIGKTTITAFCNNAGGFAIYAVGYSGTPATYGNNSLIGVNTGFFIPTGTATSGDTSQWAMKVNKVTDATAYSPQNLTITNGYDEYHAVPDKYTKVADFSTNTDSTLGSKITTTYAAFISLTQIADTYIGQVKYTLVHPQSTAAPSILTDYGIIYLQDFSNFTSEQIATVKDKLDVGEKFILIDSRDGNTYHIAKLADGNIWLLDNLALDLTNRAVVDILSENNTNATNTSLNYLRNGGSTASEKYPISGLNYADWTMTWRSYSAPLVNTISKRSTNSNDLISEASTWKYGVYYNYCAATAGSYCYGDDTNQGTSTGNATEDLCPKGWRLPTGNTGGEYRQLFLQYNSSAADYRAALRLPLSGIIEDGSVQEQESTGRWWSSTRRDNGYMYIVRVAVEDSNTTVDAARSYWRSRGYSIRCILQS